MSTNVTPTTFSRTLREALRKRFGKRVTAAFLARELDLFTQGGLILSSEAVRRWMVGLSIPRANVVAVLEEYLGRPLVNKRLNLQVQALSSDELEFLQRQISDRLTEIRALGQSLPKSR
jgi:hypothetical protein